MKKNIILFIYFFLGFISPLILSLSTSILSLLLSRNIILMLITWIFFYPKIYYKLIYIFHDFANKQFKYSINLKKENIFIKAWWATTLFFPVLVLFVIPILFKGGFGQNMKNKYRAAAASNTLATIAKECAYKIADKGEGTAQVPHYLEGYKSNKKNIAGFYVGSNRKTSSSGFVCPNTGVIKLISENESNLPSYTYNIETGEKTCRHNDPKNTLGCRDGEW